MRVGKPFMRVIKAAFGIKTSEARDFLELCEDRPEMARSFAGEYGKKWIAEMLCGSEQTAKG